MSTVGLFKVLWALFIAAMLGYTFYRSMKQEHALPGDDAALSRNNETVVWMSPLYLPLLMIMCTLIYVIGLGTERGAMLMLEFSINIVLLLSAYFAVLLIFMPLMRRYISARACATLWLLPVFLYLPNPSTLMKLATPKLLIYIPKNALYITALVWAAGFTVLLTLHTVSHLRFRRAVLAGSHPASPEVCELWSKEQAALRFKKEIKLAVSPGVSSPVTVGTTLRSMRALLPERDYTRDELIFIFRHELYHIQRRDVDSKVFLAFCTALCWFNPLVWIAARKASDDLELSCDERVLNGADADSRKEYAKLLLSCAGDGRGFSTCLSAAAGTLRYRLKSAVKPKTRFSGIIILCVMMATLVFCSGFVAVSFEKGTVESVVFAQTPISAGISSIYYRDPSAPYPYSEGASADAWDEAGLLEYISSLEVARLPDQSYSYVNDSRCVSIGFVFEEMYMWLDIEGGVLSVRNRPGSQYPVYLIKSDVDWDVIASFIDVGLSS